MGFKYAKNIPSNPTDSNKVVTTVLKVRFNIKPTFKLGNSMRNLFFIFTPMSVEQIKHSHEGG